MILTGTDFSLTAQAANAYAAMLAVRRSAPLQLVHAAHAATTEQEYADIEIALKLAAEDVRATHPSLTDVSARTADGYAGPVLVGASRAADITVVGCRGAGGFGGLSLGSVAAQVAAHAHHAVIVVRPPNRPIPTGPVVAGFDGLPSGLAALEFAAEEAYLRGVDLMVAHVYPEGRARDAADMTARAAEHCRRHPGLDVLEWQVMGDAPEHVLAGISHSAGLTVVGARGRGGSACLMLGSVSRTLIHHAHSPVAVVHP